MITVHIDGASRGNPGPAASAAIIKRDGVMLMQSAKVIGDMLTNNVAEYRALLGVLRWLAKAPYAATESITIYSDSKLVVEQVNGRWGCKDEKLQPLYAEAQALFSTLLLQASSAAIIELVWVPREQNADADRLCNQVLDKAGRATA